MIYEEAQNYLMKVLSPLCSIHSSVELYQHAVSIAKRWQFSFYDSLIIAAAQQTNCDQLISEDFQHQQKIGDLEIINPFTR